MLVVGAAEREAGHPTYRLDKVGSVRVSPGILGDTVSPGYANDHFSVITSGHYKHSYITNTPASSPHGPPVELGALTGMGHLPTDGMGHAAE